jgi:hypothetical protein
MCSSRGSFVFASTRSQSYSRYVMSHVCCTSNTTNSAPMACTVPASRNTQSPGSGVKLWSVCGAVFVSSAAMKSAAVTPSRKPA